MFSSLTTLPLGAAVALNLLGGYLLGSIPFGLLAARLGGVGDIRSIGSGNIGATNVLRTGRRDLALITLAGDAGKGAAAVLIAHALFGDTLAAVAGGAAFVGHLFPIWLGFKGGKGVATFYGVLFAIAWPVGLAAGATWITMAALFRFSSLAALTAAVLAPLWLIVIGPAHPSGVILLMGMAVLIFLRHSANIRRLLERKEPKIGASKGAPA
jgi:glycerol-3-phosphate acyltransferase PlsY